MSVTWNGPTSTEETDLNDIMAEAVNSDPVKERQAASGVLTRDKVDQALFSDCVKKMIDKTEPADTEDNKINKEP